MPEPRPGTPEEWNKVLANQGLIGYVIKGRRWPSEVFERGDLFSWGLEGLLRAVQTFDPSLGFAFSTWAISCIKNAIEDCLRKDRMARGYSRRTGENKRYFKVSSLDAMKQRNDGTEMEEHPLAAMAGATPSHEDAVLEKLTTQGDLKAILDAMRPRVRELFIILLTGYMLDEPVTFTEIGKRWGISRERVSQLYWEGVFRAEEALDRRTENPHRDRRRAQYVRNRPTVHRRRVATDQVPVS